VSKKILYRSIAYIILIILVLISFTACSQDQDVKPSPPTTSPTPIEPEEDEEPIAEPINEVEVKDVEAYFPLQVGNRWEYEGEGNEFASYTQEVVFSEGNRYQLTTDNGGTVMANIFEVRDDSIVNVYKMGESYDHKNLLKEQNNIEAVMLKEPIKMGNKWISEENTYEIIDTNASITVPLGSFDKCIVVKLTFKDGSVELLHYKAGVGLLQSEFKTDGGSIFSRLKSFTTK
jgi:hypothetical protein